MGLAMIIWLNPIATNVKKEKKNYLIQFKLI